MRNITVVSLVALVFIACGEDETDGEPRASGIPLPSLPTGPATGAIIAHVTLPELAARNVTGLATIDDADGPSWLLSTNDGNAFVFLAVAHDGTLIRADQPVDVDNVFSSEALACGGKVWVTGHTSGNLESWLFRMEADLSDRVVARFVGPPNPSRDEGDPGAVADIGPLFCVEDRVVGVVRLTRGMTVTPPIGEPVEVASDGESWMLFGADALMDEGRFVATPAERDRYIAAVAPGAEGSVVFTSVSVNGSPDSGTVTRFDPSSGATTPVALSPLSGAAGRELVTERPDATALAQCGWVPQESNERPISVGELVLTDDQATDFCALTRDDAETRLVELRAKVSDMRFAEDALWLAGVVTQPDRLLGDPGGDSAGFLIGYDLDDGSVSSSAFWAEPGRMSWARQVMPMRGEGACADQQGIGGVFVVRGLQDDTRVDYRFVLAGAHGATCTSHIATWHESPFEFGTQKLFQLSAPPTSDCAHARYLALGGGTLELRGPTGPVVQEMTSRNVELVVFTPSECALRATTP